MRSESKIVKRRSIFNDYTDTPPKVSSTPLLIRLREPSKVLSFCICMGRVVSSFAPFALIPYYSVAEAQCPTYPQLRCDRGGHVEGNQDEGNRGR